ncbi:3-hydroxyacyl-ACP dehydratase FabZ [Desulfovibrio sp. OttesenSCG-928-G15]|nr:3-hydroxyacyl-ACP dehydratase FabZ [Desulfovibrio sp. OttesenSCG-928-G15]
MISPSVQNPNPGLTLDVQRIMELLPHRYPFLLVDRVIELEPNKIVRAYKNVSINEPFFQGHFPGLPVMPGVLIVEALAQAGGFLVLTGQEDATVRDSIFLFTGIEKVRFRKPVVPGDRLELQCELLRKKMQLWKMRGQATVDGVLVAEAELTAAIVPRSDF